MEDILYDYHVAQSMAKNDPDNSQVDFNRTAYFMGVLKKHQVSEADFDSSLVYYYSHVDHFTGIYDRVNERLSVEAKRLGASVGDINRYSQLSQTGDTANIWQGDASVLLIPRPTMNRFDFLVKADSTFQLGDSFIFQFVSEHIWQTGSKDAVVCVRTAYERDSVIQSVAHVTVSGTSQLRIPANRTLKIKELRGFVYLPDANDGADDRKLMFISQIQLIRFHNKDIQNAYESEQQDSVKKDSLQRVDINKRAVPDTASHHSGTGLRSKNAPFRRGGTADRVVAGPHQLKKRD